MEYIDIINEYAWTYLIIPLLCGCAVWFTFRTRGIQFRMIKEMVRLLSESPSSNDGKEGKHISSYHAFVMSLASRIGTGNLAGVASAIYVGGPGAVFWMWVMALFGAATSFMESTLAQLYKRKGDGAYVGGPAYYILYGLKCRWAGVVYSIALIFAFAVANQLVQSNQICASITDTFSVPMPAVSITLAVLTALIIFGGVHRIAKFSAAVVPFMAVAYILLAVYVVGRNITAIPDVLQLIVTNAFGLQQAAGGALGIAVMQGVKRGLFSNEAGEGSVPNIAATAETSHPVKQGLIQSLGVFTDTILVCSCTAMIILVTGVYQCEGADGILLTTRALEVEVGSWAKYFVSAAIFFFAYSTIIGDCYYGETGMRFMTNRKQWINTFRVLTLAFVALGGFMTLTAIWSIVDLCMAALVLANVTSILLLSSKAIALLDDYVKQRRAGKDPKFEASSMPDIAHDLEAWK